MSAPRRMLLAALLLLAGIPPAATQERLVIAGRDAAFGAALSRMAEAYQPRPPNLRIERPELPGGALCEGIARNTRARSRA